MSLSGNTLLNNLNGLRAKVGSGERIAPADMGAAFGWPAEQIRGRQISIGDTLLEVGRGIVGVQPAAVFATPLHRNGVDPLHGAALYGYHAAVRWGLFIDTAGITAFNSHWLMQDRWFTLPTVEWDALEQQRTFLSAFEPGNLIDGEPDRIALQRVPNPTLLQPVDDELVERLDAWRDEALRSAPSHYDVDEQLQTLFAKLFVLRTIEDRGLAVKVPPLSDALNGPSRVKIGKLRQIFTQARKYIGSELFDAAQLTAIPLHVIAGIVYDLYIPRKIPLSSARYNFSWIDSDVLGLAYEKYLSTILQPKLPAPQLDLFREAYRDVARVSVRRAGGVYYTPTHLTKYLSQKCIDQFFESHDATLPRIADLACGSGSFLVAAVDALLEKLKERDPNTNWGRQLIEGGHITGIDVDEKAVTVARLNIWNRLTEEPDPLPLPHLSRVVIQADGLDDDTWGELPTKFDIVLGNPSFLATERVTNRSDLEARFETAKGRYEYSSLFVEQAVRVTEPAGMIGMVVPNRLFRNYNAASIRSYLTTRMNLNTIIDFGSNEVFAGTSSYIGCIVATHQFPLTQPADTVQVIEVKSFPERFVAAWLLEAEAGKVTDDKVRRYSAQHPRGGGPWVLLSTDEKRRQVQLSEISTRLDSIAGVFQVVNGLGDTAVLEKGLLQPVVFGAEVRRYEEISYNKYLLYPYINGTALSEPEIAARYPQTYRYLLNYRDILAARASISASGLRWYELVRRRDEDWLRRPKLLIRDLAPETSFAVDPDGSVFIVGGTAVVPEQEDLLFPLLAYLNSKHINALVRRTTPQFRGNFQKFEPQHLQAIPVLVRFLEDAEFAQRLGELARRATSTSESSRALITDTIESIIEEAMLAALGTAE